MRFAVSLLMFICVASLIGTVLPQNQASNTYVDQFGPFWFALFDKFNIWHIYNSWWFLLIMAFLVASTSICVLRNAPKMMRDARSFREYVRGSSLRAFHHRVEVVSPLAPEAAVERIKGWLGGQGYKWKLRVDGEGMLLAAKKGSANRLGYIFAHTAIVIICVGGLLDSELLVRAQVWLGGKQPITQNMLIADVPESGRLPAANPSFRANMLIPDGSQSASAIVSVDDGVLVQPLPFSIKLNKFDIQYYSTGMPSSFKSDVDVTDHETGKTFSQVIEVNEPLRYKGVTVYQSSFDDGGSKLQLLAYPLAGSAEKTFEVDGVVGQPAKIPQLADASNVQIDLTGLRVINVENLDGGQEPQAKDVFEHVASVTGSAAGAKNEHLRNVGPSVQYRIVGRDGQAHEFTNYMLPMTLDGAQVFLAGVRQSASEPYRYIRIPADANHSVAEFMSLRAALNDPSLRAQAAARFAQANANDEGQRPLLQKAAEGALESFAAGGFNAIVSKVPAAERERVLGFAVPMIQLSLAELRDIDRARHGWAPLNEAGADAGRWTQLALLALANLPDYPAPVFLSLKNFQQVQASVFQVARSPGKNSVYLGCIFLVIGVFSMFYIRDRRVWVWIRPTAQGSEMLAAMTSQRRTLDFNHEFERFKDAFKRLST
ncbi:cytochrome c biogenesis protein ResB [Eoetvoesiella caeni]|uniref:Cytochrome c biogenesis protein n=1 Tax=Eoetvoesiella caeni TaxID=645616 RepID=A0A366HJK0_9BURK|nr:cytochrome c biogenesis protein ResB [Eoetvoesiella caeni]MCI2807951.1 cytochrome c biogenesis protein ResB [Eoetvoesiella caeni]NYT54046.1 cytochrome c biogenesis protein ResB [Eoetvoesiella caeni]RBP41870.1 cytochrome c biogenesis protein [Eoetvoesiella caeni]